MEHLLTLAHGAIALLIAAIAIYLALKLFGKMAKFLITLIVIAVILWFVLSNPEVLAWIKQLFAGILGKNL